MAQPLTELERARLRWRARRGLLENDLMITAFLDKYETQLTDEDVLSLSQLFLLDDNTLLDLLLSRTVLEGELDTPNTRRLLAMIKER